jgi:hypothetical protein
MSWQVYVEDRERYMDNDSRSLYSEHETREEALSAARALVERSLEELRAPGQSAEQLFSLWSLFGQDAYLVPDDSEGRFSGQDYARERVAQLAGR